MNFELVYSFLIDATWFFLAGWIVILLAAYVMAFGRDPA